MQGWMTEVMIVYRRLALWQWEALDICHVRWCICPAIKRVVTLLTANCSGLTKISLGILSRGLPGLTVHGTWNLVCLLTTHKFQRQRAVIKLIP